MHKEKTHVFVCVCVCVPTVASAPLDKSTSPGPYRKKKTDKENRYVGMMSAGVFNYTSIAADAAAAWAVFESGRQSL